MARRWDAVWPECSVIPRHCAMGTVQIQRDSRDVERDTEPSAQGDTTMHNLLIASVFVLMLVAPAVVASFTGNTAEADA